MLVLLYNNFDIYSNRNGDTPFVRLQVRHTYALSMLFVGTKISRFRNCVLSELCVYIHNTHTHRAQARHMHELWMRVAVYVWQLRVVLHQFVCANDLLCHNILSPSRCVCSGGARVCVSVYLCFTSFSVFPQFSNIHWRVLCT